LLLQDQQGWEDFTLKLNESTDMKENEVTIETKRKGNTNWRNQKPPNKERGSKERKKKSMRA
jgi:hypothetical protein